MPHTFGSEETLSLLQSRLTGAEDRPSERKPFPIVGVGASRGGLTAFQQLLEQVPANSGLAFVYASHLAPERKSMLPELLSKATPMSVCEVTDGTRAEPDWVYVLPPGKNVNVSGGVFKLAPLTVSTGPCRSIDHFLCSLAEDQKSNAIGVILSGMLADGTVGLGAIKAKGGMTFAQDMESAICDGMPRSAIAGGCVDFVRGPKGIAKELTRMSHAFYGGPSEMSSPDAPGTERKSPLKPILSTLQDATGVDFTYYEPGLLRQRVTERMALRRMEKSEEYGDCLRTDGSEVRLLRQNLLVNHTLFFRDPQAFAVLKKKILPSIIQNRSPGAPIRIWVPGCSTGQEPYSIAMCLLECFDHEPADVGAKIFATDVNDNAIETARRGIYPASIARRVSPERLQRFFEKVGRSYQVSTPVRRVCVFARHNLAEDSPFSHMDLISCRNVLIYFGPASRRRGLEMLHYALKDSGFLMLGTSEVLASSDLFSPADSHCVYYKTGANRRPEFFPRCR